MAMAEVARPNEGVDNLMLGYSDLRALKTKRPLVIARGDGIRVIDENGKSYLESCASFFNASFGYSEPELAEAAYKQFKEMPLYSSAAHRTVDVVMRLTEMLAARLPMPDAHISYCCSGTEANDYAVKFMRYRNVYEGKPQKRKVISRQTSYHGSTIVDSSLGGAKGLHDSFALDMSDYRFVSQPDYFNGHLEGESEAEFVARLAQELEDVIQEAGPETIGMFFAEPICFSSGLTPPPAGYWAAIKAVLDRYDILHMDDEVITGFGRTGDWTAVDNTLGFKPDLMTLAKGISASYFPFAVTVISDDVYQGILKGSDAQNGFHHAGTLHAHPVGAAIVIRVIELMEERNILGHVRNMIPVLHKGIHAWRGHECVADTRAVGLAGAIQLDPAAFGPKGEENRGLMGQRLLEACMEHGLIVRPRADTAIIGPPLVTTAAEYEEIFALLEKGVKTLQEEMRRA
ncbi:MAG: aminotransferase class III-fold pyridoxal phosphate-dependent enzyme [Sneathiellaceae bacterium]